MTRLPLNAPSGISLRHPAFFRALITVLAAIGLVGCNGGGEETATPSATYTALVYIVGSDLESGGGAATSDLQEMTQVGSTSNVNVLVETGGASQWQNSQVSNTSVQRWRVASGGLELKGDLGNLNMGDPATLQDFITWGVATYPADKYLLILWDHGGGAIGDPTTGATFGVDENNGGDGLSLPELQQALQAAYATTGKKFDVLGFDACLMANLETASAVSPYANYLVASEELEPGSGWDYSSILTAIRSNTAISGSALGQVIADSYKAHIQNREPDAAKEITLSVVDLSKVSNVIAGLETLATNAGTDLQTSGQPAWITLAGGRSKAEEYGNGKVDMADLKHLASQLATTYSTESNALISAINAAVVYKVNGAARPNANGLSVFFPYNTFDSADLSAMVQAYNALDFSPTYKGFVGEYTGLGTQDTTAPTFTGEAFDGTVLSAQVQGGDVSAVYAVLTQSDPATGTVLIIGFASVDMQDAAGNVSYTWDGQWVTMNGSFVSMNLEDADGTIETYSIPALLNGQAVDILVMIDTTTGEYAVLGAWPGIVNGVAAREILPIAAGDGITPLFVSYDLTTDTEQEVAGTAFTVGLSGVDLGLASLPSGTYSLGFLATDYAQNDATSQFVAVSAP